MEVSSDEEEAQLEEEEEEGGSDDDDDDDDQDDGRRQDIALMIAQVCWAPNYLEVTGYSAAPETPTAAPAAVVIPAASPLAAPAAAAVPATVTTSAAPAAEAVPTTAATSAVPAAAAAAGRLRPPSAILEADKEAEWTWRMRKMDLEDAEDDRASKQAVPTGPKTPPKQSGSPPSEADAAAGASGGSVDAGGCEKGTGKQGTRVGGGGCEKGACRGAGGKGTDIIQDVGWGDRNDRGGSKGKAVLATAAASSSAASAAAADSSGCSSAASAAATGSGWGKGWQSQAWIISPSSPWPQSQSETWWAEYRRQGQGGCPSWSQLDYASRSQVMQCNSEHSELINMSMGSESRGLFRACRF